MAGWEHTVDLVVAGSGAGGMTAALVGHDLGLRTLVVEKSDQFGGSSAMSGGVIWVPDNLLMRAAGIAPPGTMASIAALGAVASNNATVTARPVTFGRPRPAIPCPNCGSLRTAELARFGSTACKAQYRCADCLEPFDYFKPH